MTPNFDLEDRLLEYSARIIRLGERLPNTRAGNHIAGQLLRSGISPLPNHGEAQAAESGNDFVRKLKISLKELRESYRWLRLIQRVPLLLRKASIHWLRNRRAHPYLRHQYPDSSKEIQAR